MITFSKKNNTIIYYIDNSEKVNTDFLPEGISCLSPADYLAKDKDEKDQLVVLCEIDINVKDQSVSRTKFYGISFVQDLRRKGYKNQVLFVSFLPDRYYKQKVLNAKILFFPGHGFQQLPVSPSEWKNKFENDIRELDELSLYDVKHHACGIPEIISERLHHLNTKFTKNENISNELKSECIAFIKEVFDYAEQEHSVVVEEFKTVKTGRDAIEKLKKICYSPFKKYGQGIDSDKNLPDWKHWKVLWLDDEEGDDSPLKEELEERGVFVEMARSYQEAMGIWERDKNTTQEICLIISDYRLETNGDCYEKQGYEFLRDIAKEGLGIGLVAYSGLTRRFLMESFKHYGIKLSIYSKIDFEQTEGEDVNYLTDQIIYLGDEHWLQRNNQPAGNEWETIRKYYLDYKNSYSYYSSQLNIAKTVNTELNDFIEYFNSCSNLENLWRIVTNEKLLVPTNKYEKRGEKLRTEAVLGLMLSRRMFIAMYGFLISEHNKNKILAPKYFDRYVKYLIRNSSSGTSSKNLIGENFDLETLISDIKDEKTFDQVKTFLALPDEKVWPIGLLPEEYAWLQDDSSLNLRAKDEIEAYWKLIQVLIGKIGDLFNADKHFVKLLLEVDNGYVFRARNRTIFFNERLAPTIRNLDEFRLLLESVSNTFHEANPGLKSSFKHFIDFLLDVEQWANDKPQMFKSLGHFIQNLGAGKYSEGEEDLISYYFRLFEPWWQYRPNPKKWDNQTIESELQYRRELFLAACSSLDRVSVEKEIKSVQNKRKKEFENYTYRYDLKLICDKIFLTYKEYKTDPKHKKDINTLPLSEQFFLKNRCINHSIERFKSERNEIRYRSEAKEIIDGRKPPADSAPQEENLHAGFRYFPKGFDKYLNQHDEYILDTVLTRLFPKAAKEDNVTVGVFSYESIDKADPNPINQVKDKDNYVYIVVPILLSESTEKNNIVSGQELKGNSILWIEKTKFSFS